MSGVDRRRVNGPAGNTALPISLTSKAASSNQRTTRHRAPGALRKIFLKTGLTPSASGSAYLEIEPASASASATQNSIRTSCLKLACTVHGPKPLSRSAPFTPQLLLTTRVKIAPFASHQRRGYIPDASERDLAAHLETALRGSIIGERWPKSGLDIIVTVLEGEEGIDHFEDSTLAGTSGMMSILSGCINVASAAIADAGVDSVDLVTGGVAAVTVQPDGSQQIVLDPSATEHERIKSACVVGYLQARDEITEIWAGGRFETSVGIDDNGALELESLLDMAVEAACASRVVVTAAVKECTLAKIRDAGF